MQFKDVLSSYKLGYETSKASRVHMQLNSLSWAIDNVESAENPDNEGGEGTSTSFIKLAIRIRQEFDGLAGPTKPMRLTLQRLEHAVTARTPEMGSLCGDLKRMLRDYYGLKYSGEPEVITPPEPAITVPVDDEEDGQTEEPEMADSSY